MNNVQNDTDDTSGAMSINAVSSHSKKRAIAEVDKSYSHATMIANNLTNEVNMAESNPQDLIPTDLSGQTLDISWREIQNFDDSIKINSPAIVQIIASNFTINSILSIANSSSNEATQ